MDKYRPFSTRIERESHFPTKHWFFLYMTPWVLSAFLPIVDVMLETRGFILLTIAAGMFIYSFKYISKEIKRIKSTYQWIKTKATVNKKAIVEFWSPCTKLGTPYRANILYSYTYEEELYQSDTFALDVFNVKGCNHLYSSIDELKEDMDKLICNNKITIYVNPDDPSKSVIKRGLSQYEEPSYVMLFISYIVVIIIFSALFVASIDGVQY